jgi:hypothetical protein
MASAAVAGSARVAGNAALEIASAAATASAFDANTRRGHADASRESAGEAVGIADPADPESSEGRVRAVNAARLEVASGGGTASALDANTRRRRADALRESAGEAMATGGRAVPELSEGSVRAAASVSGLEMASEADGNSVRGAPSAGPQNAGAIVVVSRLDVHSARSKVKVVSGGDGNSVRSEASAGAQNAGTIEVGGNSARTAPSAAA